MKKNVLVAITVLATCLPGLAFGQRELKIQVNGQEVKANPPAFAEANRTMVPLRFMAEELGYQVAWYQESQDILLIKENFKEKTFDQAIYLKLGDKEALLFDQGDVKKVYEASIREDFKTSNLSEPLKRAKKVKLDVVPVVKENRTFVPLRAIVELFQQKVTWNQEAYQVEIEAEQPKTDKEIAGSMLYSKLPEVYKKKPFALIDGDLDKALDPVKKNFYSFALVEDHKDHQVTVDRYGVDLNKGKFYRYDIVGNRWELDKNLNK